MLTGIKLVCILAWDFAPDPSFLTCVMCHINLYFVQNEMKECGFPQDWEDGDRIKYPTQCSAGMVITLDQFFHIFSSI